MQPLLFLIKGPKIKNIKHNKMKIAKKHRKSKEFKDFSFDKVYSQ